MSYLTDYVIKLHLLHPIATRFPYIFMSINTIKSSQDWENPNTKK